MTYKYELAKTNEFVRDVKRCKKRGCNMDLLDDIVKMLRKGEKLPEKTETTL